MKKNWTQKPFLYYVFFALILLVALFSSKVVLNPLITGCLLIFTILIPGFSLSRILKLEVPEISGNLVLWMACGWATALTFAFLAIIFGITIHLFTIIFALFICIIFILALGLDLLRKIPGKAIEAKTWFKLENIPYLILFIYLFTVVLNMLSGSLFKGGDAMYHLSTIRKVIEGSPLTVNNLSYVKDEIHVAYGFPVWHILIGFMTKLAQTNMFFIWKDLTVPLLLMALVAWYWLFLKILPTKYLAILSLFFFTFFFFNDRVGFILSTLPIPHSLMQFLLLPILAGLSINYIFNSKFDYRQITLISVLSVLTGVVHLTGYFYYLVIMVGLFLVLLISRFKDPDYKAILSRTAWLIFPNIILILIFALILELKTHSITKISARFLEEDYPTTIKYSTFAALTMLSKYAYLGLPFILLLNKKYRPLSLILGSFLMLPLLFNSFTGEFIVRSLGTIFAKRIDAIMWHFVVWSVVFGLVLMLIDRLVSAFGKNIKKALNVTFVLFSLILIFIEKFKPFGSEIYNFILSPLVENKMDHYYLAIIAVLLIAVLILLFLQSKFKKINDFFELREIQNIGVILLGLTILLIVFISPAQKSLFKSYKSINLLTSPSTSTADKYALNYIGGKEVRDFIKNNIPAKSVFDANSGYFYLPEILDVHMPYYSNAADTICASIYSDKYTLEKKINRLKAAKIEYLLVSGGDNKVTKVQSILDQNPEVFQKIYQGKAVIYKINQNAIR